MAVCCSHVHDDVERQFCDKRNEIHKYDFNVLEEVTLCFYEGIRQKQIKVTFIQKLRAAYMRGLLETIGPRTRELNLIQNAANVPLLLNRRQGFLFAQQRCKEYENAWLGTIFGCKREVIEQWIQFHSEGLHNLWKVKLFLCTP